MYKPLQKKNSSWTPTTAQKKNKSPSKLGHFSIQPKPNKKSSQPQEIGEYSRDSADRLAANVMRSLEAKDSQETETPTVQPQSESRISVADVVGSTIPTATPRTLTPQVRITSEVVSEKPIQRQCADCASEQQEQSGEERKDVEEMSVAASGIQTKLTVGAPGDVYEQEADRVAAQVMSMSLAPDHSPQVQRFGEEDNPIQRWSLAQSITPVVQRRVDEQVQMQALVQRAFQSGGNQASGDLESRLNGSKGGGHTLAPEVRAFMEPRFGADFSGVRVHTGGEAVQMNRELGAQAFTHERDIFFGEGKSPGNNELTAHELTHVVQQNGISHIQRESAPSNHEKMLDEAINIVQHALNAFAAQTSGEGNADMTATPQVKQQEQGLRTALNHLLALKGSDKVDDIISATRPILAASKGDSAGASPPSIGEPSPQESSEGLTPNVQRAATLALGAPLLAAGPPGWAAYAALAVGTLIVGGIIAHEMSRTRTKPRAVPRTRTRRRRRGPYPINWPYLGGRGLPLVAPNLANSISIGRRLVRTTPPPRNRALIDLFKATNTVQTGQAVHHVTPLFLGGPDALGNLAAVWISYHIAGHNALNNQPHLAAYGISPYLPNHPPGTPYIVSAIV